MEMNSQQCSIFETLLHTVSTCQNNVQQNSQMFTALGYNVITVTAKILECELIRSCIALYSKWTTFVEGNQKRHQLSKK